MVLLVEHAGIHGARIAIVGNRIPGTEYEVVEIGERNEVFDERSVAIGALAQADRVHLGQGAKRLRESAPNGFYAGNECRGHGSEAGEEYAELTLGRTDLRRLLH